MQHIILLLFLTILMTNCNNGNSTREKELALKERELFIKEETLKQQELNRKEPATSTKKPRKLRYLYFANGGLIGYFDEGTVTVCPGCELLQDNIKGVYQTRVIKKYTLQSDGSLLADDHERKYPGKGSNGFTEGWAMVDYKCWLK